MLINNLIAEITEGLELYPIADWLMFKCEMCDRFGDFIAHYHNSDNEIDIRNKFFNKRAKTPKNKEEIATVLTELQAAHLMLSLDEKIVVEYEKYGKGPDFTITFAPEPENQLVIFNLEVTQIKEQDHDI